VFMIGIDPAHRGAAQSAVCKSRPCGVHRRPLCASRSRDVDGDARQLRERGRRNVHPSS